MEGGIYQESTYEFLQSKFKRKKCAYTQDREMNQQTVRKEYALPEIIISLKFSGSKFKNTHFPN